MMFAASAAQDAKTLGTFFVADLLFELFDQLTELTWDIEQCRGQQLKRGGQGAASDKQRR